MTADHRDLCVRLEHRPGALADFGAILGRAGVSLEGGGVFVHGDIGIAHFLVRNAERAAAALSAAGLPVATVSEVVMLRLDQETPGQLGTAARWMAAAGVTIDAQYSDHDGNLVLVVPVDQLDAARGVADRWTSGAQPGR